MKAMNKASITVETDLDKSLTTFQSNEARHDLELITMAVRENRTEIEERELHNGIVMVTIEDAEVANAVVKSLEEMDFKAQIVDRKRWLIEQKKKRRGETGK